MVDIGADNAVYEHIIEPDEPEAIVEVELEVEEEISTCSMDGCTEVIGDHAVECDDCHQEFCATHTDVCHWCDDPVCTACAATYQGSVEVYCTYCLSNLTDCCVCGDTINSDANSSNYCESHDAYCCHACYGADDKCENCYEGESTAEHGTTHLAPWCARGVHETNTIYPEADEKFHATDAIKLWKIDQNLSLNAGAADFYLLEMVENILGCGEIAEPMLVVMAEEAKAMRRTLIAVYDQTLTGYADMAIGGELRYHMAVGGGRHLPGDRADAWKVWKLLRERGGPDILLDAAKLFNEIHGSGVGGKRWADAALLLHSRVTGRITPEQWVDRCFTLQHNGGAFTNKIAWGTERCESGQDICNVIGPAHDANPPDFETLLKYTSSQAGSLVRDWWPIANRNRMRWRLAPWKLNTRGDAEYLRATFIWFRAYVHRGWAGGTGRNQALEQYLSDQWRYSRRFTPFLITKAFHNEHALHIPWSDMPTTVARSVVNQVLNEELPYPSFKTFHDHSGKFLVWLCDLLAAFPHVGHRDQMFEALMSRGVQIPRAQHAVAGLTLL